MVRGENAAIFLVWAGLLALLATTAAISFLHLGPWNGVLNLAIAAAKAGAILWFYMHMRHTRPLVRLAAAVAPLWLAIFFALAFGDYLTR